MAKEKNKDVGHRPVDTLLQLQMTSLMADLRANLNTCVHSNENSIIPIKFKRDTIMPQMNTSAHRVLRTSRKN